MGGHNNLQLALSLTHSLSLTHYLLLFVAPPAFALMLLLLLWVALLIIALLMVPDKHTTLECQAKGGVVRGAYLSRVDELALPGCCSQLAGRRLLANQS